MRNREFLSTILDFFDLIIKFYKQMKNEGDINVNVPTQNSIGTLFGGLGKNYGRYRKKGVLPKIWDILLTGINI